jgi:methionine-S-sulfoxide reductase
MTKTITLGGGCFWCTEAIFQRVEGVLRVVPGYAGGNTKDPTYKQVSTGTTGHAEVIRITYDIALVPLERLLRIFFATHNPTTPNMQGADIGTEYRSIIMYDDAADVPIIQMVLKDVQSKIRDDVVTQVRSLDVFYEAEDYHHNYYEKNAGVPYCQMVIDPKLDKLRAYLRENPV